MKLSDVISIIQSHRAEIDGFDVRSLSIFGSFATNSASERSDVDVLVEFNGPATFKGYMGLKLMLEELIGRRVDLVTMRALRSEMREEVLQEAVKVA